MTRKATQRTCGWRVHRFKRLNPASIEKQKADRTHVPVSCRFLRAVRGAMLQKHSEDYGRQRKKILVKYPLPVRHVQFLSNVLAKVKVKHHDGDPGAHPKHALLVCEAKRSVRV